MLLQSRRGLSTRNSRLSWNVLSTQLTLETIVPGLYPGRTRHIHLKAQAPNGRILTTQRYFPGEPRNASDGIYSPALLMSVENGASGQNAHFTFVLTT